MSLPIFDAIPGLAMPVSQVVPALANMWRSARTDNCEAPGQFRASQLNLVIHLGVKTTAEQARSIFNTAIEFAQRYPCRLVFLCPQQGPMGSMPMQAKLFSQCYIGPNQRAMCACEALVLAYSLDDMRFLEDQVSVWLENDLPTYYWFHRVPSDIIEIHYMAFLHGCRKIVYDSSVEGVCFKNMRWSRPSMVADLTRSRLLPMRLALGQFLSRFNLGTLAKGLQQVAVSAIPQRIGEAQLLLSWQLSALQGCGASLEGLDALRGRSFEAAPAEGSPTIAIEWLYKDENHYFNWQFFEAQKRATLKAALNTGFTEQTIHLQPLSGPEALAESIFFSS